MLPTCIVLAAMASLKMQVTFSWIISCYMNVVWFSYLFSRVYINVIFNKMQWTWKYQRSKNNSTLIIVLSRNHIRTETCADNKLWMAICSLVRRSAYHHYAIHAWPETVIEPCFGTKIYIFLYLQDDPRAIHTLNILSYMKLVQI